MMNRGIHLSEEKLWSMVNAGFLAGIVLLVSGSFAGISPVRSYHILAALAAVAVFTYLSNLDVRGRILGIAGIVMILSSVGTVAGVRECILFFRSYVHWIGGYPTWQPEWVVGYETIQAVLVAAGCCFLAWMMEKNFRIKAAGGIFLAAVLLYFVFTGQEMSKPGVALTICYIVVAYVEWNQRHWNKEKRRNVQVYMLWVMPFMALYAVLISLMSAPDTPYQWRIVKDICQRFQESFTRFTYYFQAGSEEEYDLTLCGFSERGEIGSDTVEDDREIMRICSENGKSANVYLTGKVYDTFDGRQWTQLNKNVSRERYLDSLETMYAIRRYDKNYFMDYMQYADLEIEYRFLRSRFLFAPLKAISVRQEGQNLNFTEEGGSLFFDELQGYGTEYEVSFYRLNMGSDVFERFLEEAGTQAGDEELLVNLLKEMEKRTGESADLDGLEKYKEEIALYYAGQTPVSEEVEAYLAELTADEETDLGKLRAIEAELSSFDYTLTPGDLPDGVSDSGDFLDYFLLESRQGFCTHFATAFTLLARQEGYAARYVQGFCVPLKKDQETIVSSDMAHAWPEVYLEGIGWIPFEPTPGYSEIRYAPWALQSDRSGESAALDEVRRGDDYLVQIDVTQQEEKDYETEGYVGGRDNILPFFRICGVMLLSVFFAAVFILLLNRMIGRYRYRKMSAEGKFKTEVHRNLQILSSLGIKRKGETLEEFRRLAEGKLPEEGMLSFLEDYEEILYGNRVIDSDDLQKIKKQQSELLILLKKKSRKRAILFFLQYPDRILPWLHSYKA